METYTIELTKEEATVLKLIWWRVGGSPDTSLRKYTDSASKKLPPDINFGSLEERKALYDGSIQFTDNSIRLLDNIQNPSPVEMSIEEISQRLGIKNLKIVKDK